MEICSSPLFSTLFFIRNMFLPVRSVGPILEKVEVIGPAELDTAVTKNALTPALIHNMVYPSFERWTVTFLAL